MTSFLFWAVFKIFFPSDYSLILCQIYRSFTTFCSCKIIFCDTDSSSSNTSSPRSSAAADDSARFPENAREKCKQRKIFLNLIEKSEFSKLHNITFKSNFFTALYVTSKFFFTVKILCFSLMFNRISKSSAFNNPFISMQLLW